ncbi:radical SAM protein [bacterium]|nr:radical SAM protein [bacterium]
MNAGLPVGDNLSREALSNFPEFAVRNEAWGSFIFVRSLGRYYALDKQMSNLLLAYRGEGLSQDKDERLDQLYRAVYGNADACDKSKEALNRKNIQQVVMLLEARGVVKDSRFLGKFVDNVVPDILQAEDEENEDAEKRKLVAPLSVNLQLTRTCRNHCRHCWVLQMPSADGARELDKKEVKELIERLVASGVFVINFCGGFAVGRKDFAELVKYAIDKGMYVNVSVEGAALTKEVIANLISLEVRNYRIGLAAGNVTTWDNMRRPNNEKAEKSSSSRDRFVKRVYDFLMRHKQSKHSAKIAFRVAVVKTNSGEYLNMAQMLRDILSEIKLKIGDGFKKGDVVLHLDPAWAVSPSNDGNLFLNENEIKDLIAWVNNNNADGQYPFIIETRAKEKSLAKRHTLDGFEEPGGFRSCFISWNGGMYPNAEWSLTRKLDKDNDIRQHSIGDIWLNNDFSNFRQHFDRMQLGL